jgi:F-type H+-transporting ATPase subunit gamma
VRNSQQVTQAMKTVAMARFKKAHRSMVERRPFWHAFPELAVSLSRKLNIPEHPYLQVRREKKILVVVMTSDKGLCGSFNSNLLEMASRFLQEKKETAEILVIPIGKKAVNYFKRSSYRLEKSYFERVEKKVKEISHELSHHLDYLFVFQKIDAVYVIYNEFRSIIAPRMTLIRFMPLTGVSDELEVSYLEPDWEPEAQRIIDYLLKFYLKSQLQHFLLESQAAEQASRMMAMENATKNAEEIISDLVLLMNKIRQASITKELLEIQTAVEAMRQQGE